MVKVKLFAAIVSAGLVFTGSAAMATADSDNMPSFSELTKSSGGKKGGCNHCGSTSSGGGTSSGGSTSSSSSGGTPVPAPAGLALFGLGTAGLIIARRKRTAS